MAPVGPVARMPTNPAPVVIRDVAAEAAAVAAAAAMARTTPVAHTPMQMVQELQQNRVAYGTRKDKHNHNRMVRIVDEFLAFQTEQDPTKDWSDGNSWGDANNGFGCFFSAFLLWAMWKRVPTLGYLCIMAHDMKAAYIEIRDRFPGWSSHANPSRGLQELKDHSSAFTATLKSIKRIFIGKIVDVKRANPMFLSDIRRFRECMSPTPVGFRNVALLYTMHESGARGITFTKSFALQPHYDEEEKRYTIYYRAHKRRDQDMSVKACVLSVEASEVFHQYWSSKDAVSWTYPHLMFGLDNTASISEMMKKLCVHAGYPERYFSSHSMRAGALTNTICQAILNGTTPGVAQLDARVLGDFGVNSDALKSYIRPMADEVYKYKDSVNHMSELTVEQLHPNLVGKMKGPFRKVRMNAGLPQLPVVMETVRKMLDILEQDGDKSTEAIAGRKKSNSSKDSAHLTALAHRMERAGLLHQDLWECAKKMAGNKCGDYAIRKHVGTMLRCMVVTEDLTPAMLQEDPPRMPVPSEYLVKYCKLKPVPKNYKQVEQIKPRFDCGSSTNVSFLVEHFKNRRVPRAVPVVHVGDKEYGYDELTVEQLAMIQARQDQRTPIDPDLFEALAMREDDTDNEEDT